MKKILSMLLAVCLVLGLSLPVCAASSNMESAFASMKPALIILFVILLVLALSCIIFTAVSLVSRRKSESGKSAVPTVLLVIMYIVTVLVLVCTLLCVKRYVQVKDQLYGVPNVPSESTSSETTQETTTQITTEETTQLLVSPELPTLSPEKTDASDPANWNVKWQVKANGTLEEISFGDGEDYYPLPGIAGFRGNNYRTGSAYGTASISQQTLTKLWSKSIGSLDGWPGIGWTGQPLVVQWDEETKAIMNLYDSKKSKENLVEVIATTLDGNIYFYDLEDGSYTRDPLNIGMSFKGTGALDPRGWPIMYAGSGLTNGGKYPRMYAISLIDCSILMEQSGGDDYAYRGWYAFDSSPMISAETDTVIWPGESGVLYAIKLNTKFDKAAGTLTMSPETVVKTRYSMDGDRTVGYESSSIIVGNYLYLGDNGGMFYCIDLRTMDLVWSQHTKDDVNATPVFEWGEDGNGYIYTATSMEYAGGNSYIYKLNANTGEILWTKTYSGIVYDYDISGGILSSPVLGKKGTDLEGMIIYAVAKTNSAWGGTLVALDTDTGNVVWEKKMDNYTWSSPVGVYTDEGKGYIIIGDSAGYLKLIDGKTGDTLYSENLGSNMEASPIVFNDILVIGTRGCQVWGIKIQ